MVELLHDCVEAVLDAVLEDETTAIIIGIPLLFCLAPIYLLWAWWPRKRPLNGT